MVDNSMSSMRVKLSGEQALALNNKYSLRGESQLREEKEKKMIQIKA